MVDEKTGIKYPDISVQLTGYDGNAFVIMGRVSAALRDAGVGPAERDLYASESMSGSYEDLLRTAARWVSVS